MLSFGCTETEKGAAGGSVHGSYALQEAVLILSHRPGVGRQSCSSPAVATGKQVNSGHPHL